MSPKNTEVLDSVLAKQADFLDFWKPPEIPRYFAPQPVFGMGKKKTKDLKKTQQKELDMWHRWNQGGRKPTDLAPLHQSFKPVLRKAVSQYAGKVPIPASAIQHEFNKQFVNAVKSYDPSKAQLNSWVTTNLRKASRYIKTYQNIGKIPEGQIQLITPYSQAVEDLTAKLGHEPDTKTVADHMGVPQRQVVQLEKELRQDLATSRFMSDPAEILAPKELEALKLIQYDLPAEERTVYEYTFGMNGRPALKPGEIAKTTGIHPSKISRIRKKLQGKVLEAMEVL